MHALPIEWSARRGRGQRRRWIVSAAVRWFSQIFATIGLEAAMRVPLDSSLLAWVSYDVARSQLQVQLRSRERYVYFQVPPACYQALLAADSSGAYFNRHIRNRFPFQHSSRSEGPIVLAAPHKTK